MKIEMCHNEMNTIINQKRIGSTKTKIVIILLIMHFLVIANAPYSKLYSQESRTNKTAPGIGITFKIDELSKPEKQLKMSSHYAVLNRLVDLSQRNDKKRPANIIANSRLPDNLVNYGYHSFFDGMYQAYMDHRPVVLSPDVIWLLISQGFSQHVNANAEKLRHHLVNFNGKLTLIVNTAMVTLDNPNSP